MQSPISPVEEKPVTELRKLQLIELNLLKNFDKLCKKHNLTYWIAYGTVLGAVRHGGFIPWDDDIDVCMPMKDYKKFLTIAEKELPEYILLCYKRKGSKYNKLFAKLMDKRTTFVEKYASLCDGEFYGVYLDIFPYIKYPAISEKLTSWFTEKMMLLNWRKNQYQRITIPRIFFWLFVSVSLACLKFIWNILSLKCGEYMELIPEDNGYFKRVKCDDIFPLKPIHFEDADYPAPNNTDAYLKTFYNDYMTLPPEEKRQPHYLYFNTEKSYFQHMGKEK